jgi:glycosyltransferase involved in cell wall biosynthesis
MPDVRLSVVIACFNEDAVVDEMYRRMAIAARQTVGESFEIIFVNDGSTDTTYDRMVALSVADPHIIIVHLSRNFGHQVALSAGLAHSQGDRVLLIDADLQDPPEALPDMYRVMDEAQADVVYGQRIERAGESLFKRVTASLFYRVLSMMTDVAIPVDAGDFRLMTRKVVDTLNTMPEQHRFLRGMSMWIGFRQVPLQYRRAPRAAGSTKYPLTRMLRFAVDAITSFSMRPLRLSFYVAFTMVFFAALAFGYVVYSWLLERTVRGWASILALFLIFGSAQLIVLGIIGEYVGRIYMQTKQRPLFVVSEIIRSGIANEPIRAAHPGVSRRSSDRELARR